MSTVDASEELYFILDFILNKSTARDLDAIHAALERRRQDSQAMGTMSSLNPELMARHMSETIQGSINGSMASIRNTIRNFASDIIAKEAPELSIEQTEELLDAWIQDAPPRGDSSIPNHAPQNTEDSSYGSLVVNGRVNGLPPQALYSMVAQFIEYSAGAMSVSEQAQLREQFGDWAQVYWGKFPSAIKKAVKGYLDGRFSNSEFEGIVCSLLGL